MPLTLYYAGSHWLDLEENPFSAASVSTKDTQNSRRPDSSGFAAHTVPSEKSHIKPLHTLNKGRAKRIKYVDS